MGTFVLIRPAQTCYERIKLTWAIYTTDDGLAGNEVRDLFVDSQGRIWAGTWGGAEGGASVFTGENWTPFTVDEGLAHKDVNAVFVDREGNVWFATERGLSLFDGSEWTTYTEEDGLADDVVRLALLHSGRSY